MAIVSGLRCVRCGATYSVDHFTEDCPACRAEAPSNLSVTYDDLRVARPRPDNGIGSQLSESGLWRYAEYLPVARADAVSLGEGATPLHHLARAGGSVGLAALYGKDESRNPTWSFKDRLASVAISAAKARGAKVIVSSSSGNAGGAAAAYAAKAGLPCVVFTFKGAAGPMVTQMRAYGAMVLGVEDKAERWTLMQQAVRRYGWFPTSPFFSPAVGSNPFGIEGYKTIAYEIAEQMDWQVPDWCVLPVCYGDALYGMWKGFEDMVSFGWTDRMPRMVAAEIYGSVKAAIQDETDALPEMPKTHDTVAISIGATRSTFQALEVVRGSGGAAITIANADMQRWQNDLARFEGIYAEASSVAPLAAVEQLRRGGRIRDSDSVVALFTASGLKDPAVTVRSQGDLPIVSGGFESAVGLLKDAYGFQL